MAAGRMVSAREIVGKRIVAFDPGAYITGRHREYRVTMHQPTITLDDGSVLYFSTEEQPDGGDYGTSIGRAIRKSR